jgi:hypothetical protein
MATGRDGVGEWSCKEEAVRHAYVRRQRRFIVERHNGRDWGGAGFVESDIISSLKVVNKSGSLTICISYQTSCLLSTHNHKLWAYIF